MNVIGILKALSDESRLSIYQLLIERNAYIEVISERLKLAPSTVSFHLKKLNEVGLVTSYRDQYYTIYSAKTDVLELSVKQLLSQAKVDLKAQDKEEEQFKEKTLKSFFKYGKLIKIPTQKKKREWVLEKVSHSFQGKKSYSLEKAQQILAEIYAEDPGLLLKELQTAGHLQLKENLVLVVS
ncbi:hypothetical protein AZI86_01415 [Bdellovibrio bacteriovorus]|uniref:HTH arsR-type domain-containing protein n=1 Tax=Bdellovibrio bacteriovorus TaxID=959 RepID=A0A150WMN7_BDEBC|nr:metalloregulator ArsR/SmtB family transcription factor [Bdellovibrio bacteriovorus]KYG65763.1 hypothetical protein AZI86_01415 [Bdellovibrio bacteriovorus]